MKQSTFNFICLGVAILSGVSMFFLKYYVESQEKSLAALRRQIVNDRRELHLLQADWAVLTDPQHLRELIKETGLKPLQAKQIIQPDSLSERPTSVEQVSGKGEG